MQSDSEILEGVLAEFTALAAYPRPSEHEKAVSDYLLRRLRQLGLDPIQDNVYNIIADVPATPGKESVPLTIIQGHMDMVCVAAPGRAYDPLRDAIVLKRDGDILSAQGTSLGADDGIAEAMALYLLTQDFPHGPLRIIFTVNEEAGMTGAKNLDQAYLQDASYIINCDSEAYDEIIVGSAGSSRMEFSRVLTHQAVQGNAALTIAVSGLLGGHSGGTINDGKANAIKELALVLQYIARQGISLVLADVAGGQAPNVIPAEAHAVIVIDGKDGAAVRQAVRDAAEEFRLIYGAIETTAAFTVDDADVPTQVFSADDTKSLVQLLCLLHFGVFAMNQTLTSLPDLSANIGKIFVEDGTVKIRYLPRSSSDARLRALCLVMPELADLTGFSLYMKQPSPAWTKNANSCLTPLMASAFKEITGKDAKIQAVHGGLETGYFYACNPNLDIVSVGATTQGIHSPQEVLYLSTIAPLVKTIMTTLGRL